MRGKCTTNEMLVYIPAQIAAAVLAALLTLYLKDSPTVEAFQPDPMRALLAEFLFTFALCYVVLNVATSKDHPTNSFYGLAIGFTVLAGAVAVGGISGGAFNPAVTFAGAVMGIFAWPTLWVYLVAQVIAGAAAGLTFLALNPDDK